MGIVIVEISGGVADLSHVEDTHVTTIDWDNVVADRSYAEDLLERVEWNLLPPKHEQRIKAMIAEIWDDLEDEP